ncbi:hypothetical protein OAR19_00055 [bacterium]|nr:hypothetical protein [bacterium]
MYNKDVACAIDSEEHGEILDFSDLGLDIENTLSEKDIESITSKKMISVSELEEKYFGSLADANITILSPDDIKRFHDHVVFQMKILKAQLFSLKIPDSDGVIETLENKGFIFINQQDQTIETTDKFKNSATEESLELLPIYSGINLADNARDKTHAKKIFDLLQNEKYEKQFHKIHRSGSSKFVYSIGTVSGKLHNIGQFNGSAEAVIVRQGDITCVVSYQEKDAIKIINIENLENNLEIRDIVNIDKCNDGIILKEDGSIGFIIT